MGDASSIPFGDESFDFIICQAAFKNFSRPEHVLNEMHRVLRAGGTAVIQDMNKDASAAAIDNEVSHMRLGSINAFMTRQSLGALRRRAYTPEQFKALAAARAFGSCQILTSGIGMEVRLTRSSR